MITPANGFNKDPPATANPLSRGEQWLGSLTASVASSQGPVPPRRPPALGAHARSQSLGSPPDGPSLFLTNQTASTPAPLSLPAIPPRSPFHNTAAIHSSSIPPSPQPSNRSAVMADPFDAEWAALATRSPSNTNPFLQNSVVKTFEVRM